MIYLDNAATTMHKPECVAQAVADAILHMGNAGRGAHDASLDASRLVYDTRLVLAEFFGMGSAERVAFTANSTESLNIAIQGLLKPGDHVITTAMEHNSVLRPLYLMRERGISLTILPVDEKGMISYSQMEEAIRENTRAIVCTHASNLTGNVVDIRKVGQLCRDHQLTFVLDASQSAGVFPIHMQKDGVDVLCFTGHKSLLGPQGIGGICVREGIIIRPLVVGGSGVQTYSESHPVQMPTALEAGTLNGPGIAGLHASLGYLREIGIHAVRARENQLMRRFYEGVSTLEGITVYGDFSQSERAPIVTINIRDYDSGEVSDELAQTYGISTRAGAHCAPLMHEAFGTKEQGAVRFSMSYFNTEDEIDSAVAAVRELAME